MDKTSRFIEYENFDQIRFTWGDMHGIARSRSVSKKYVKKYIEEGIGFWEGCLMITPNEAIIIDVPCAMGNIMLRPQEETFKKLPWATNGKYKIGEFICEPYWSESNNVQNACPRFVARQQINKLKESGYKIFSSFEMEFQLLDKSSDKLVDDRILFNCIGHATFEEFMYKAEEFLHEAGIDIELQQIEGAASQLEFTLETKYGIDTADQAFCFKQAMKEIALNQNMRATFMSKPFAGFGNGNHFNFSIIDANGQNMFYDPGCDDGLSRFAKHWIAGVLTHAKALTAICCPTVNCYRRLFTFGCPSLANWGIEDRTALLRVKNQGPDSTYIENRLISGSSNPYLSFAATIAAGMDGVMRNLECPDPDCEKDGSEKLPSSLAEALECLKEDTILCESLGEEFINWFCSLKHAFEIPTFKDWSGSDESEEAMEKERKIYMINI